MGSPCGVWPYRTQLIREKVVGKRHKSARDKTERWTGYSLEFCLLA